MALGSKAITTTDNDAGDCLILKIVRNWP